MEEVKVEPKPVSQGDKVRINYQGLLAKNGAEQVYLHAGANEHDNWNEIHDIEMNYEGDNTWTTEMEIPRAQAFSFCFKDSANNWDNNNGHNWTYEVQG
jgi:hypothetical protein